MEPGFKFAKGEKVLCYYQGIAYEAKILKCLLTDKNQKKYLVHYFGWNKKWDEWALEVRLKKYNLTDVELEDELAGDVGTIVNKTQAGSHSDSSQSADIIEADSSDSDGEEDTLEDEITATGSCSANNSIVQADSSESDGEEDTLEDEITATGSCSTNSSIVNSESSDSDDEEDTLGSMSDVDVQNETDDEIRPKVDIKIIIPDELKSVLLYDWYAINREFKLATIPAKVTVQDVVNQYVEFRKDSNEQENTEMLTGLIDYFNLVLDKKLLYDLEQSQYNQIANGYPNMRMSSVYGCIHMIRLFVKLGPFLKSSELDESSAKIVLEQIDNFIKFLAENSAKYFDKNEFSVQPEFE
ncbi:nuA4 complex subunit EAF3 homolog [Teleopsis dalmanni]|uniref:nuA4 complex subunit EAF3 homolog n=1 Tax=Teleopsis dalmanni TaxID=139649 RepID=UPI0018CDD1CD|nr:nuA4 complex subunit EAF3 homolog [Teleopsis dalmanni]